MSTGLLRFLGLALILACAGCANITTPTGGKKDIIPPKLLSVSPADSLLNTKVKRIELTFDEYITVSDASKEVQISPILAIQPTAMGINKRVVVKIVDSLLEDSTTYRVSFGNAIKDLHEGNPFTKYSYTFSTGPYFDSLQLQGTVINAATGLPDTGSVQVELYSASENDSAVVRHKPKYITSTDNKGAFVFKGLPRRRFRIYALKDANNNLIYDGLPDKIAFNNTSVMPGDTTRPPINLKLFAEVVDSSTIKKVIDTTKSLGLRSKTRVGTNDANTYTINVDTTNLEARTFDLNHNLIITFNRLPVINKDKISLAYDNNGVATPAVFTFIQDTSHPYELRLKTKWLENTVYTLRLAKGFAKDTAGTEIKPGRFVFRTMQDDDYGKITVNLPSKYYSPRNRVRGVADTVPDYLLMVVTDKDTVYQQLVTDTVVHLVRLRPDKYSFRVIVDKNHNGKWDTGDLFAKKQPEDVISYYEPVTLKIGWDNTIDDFEQQPKPKPKLPDVYNK